MGIDPIEAKKIIWQMVKACDFMHTRKVIHRDIKPENMLLSRNGVLKMCDFGFAKEMKLGSDKLTEYVSTRWYRAPELLVGHPNYSYAVDIWAIGCIFVELVTGRALYMGNSDFEML
jgi:cyclin-dependent kinase-like